VHDPNDSLRTGDVVAITPGYRRSKQKRHVVKHIIAPSGTPIEARPPIPTEEERWAADTEKKAAKDARKAARHHTSSAQSRGAKESSSAEVESTNSDVD
jgi:small subunit ribosomal protein S17